METGSMTFKRMPPAPKQCELCARAVPDLTRHHLIPRRLHRKPAFRRQFSREEMITRVCWVCRPCHNAIHHARSEQQLGLYYNTREALLAMEEVHEFVTWLKDKPAGFKPKHRR